MKEYCIHLSRFLFIQLLLKSNVKHTLQIYFDLNEKLYVINYTEISYSVISYTKSDFCKTHYHLLPTTCYTQFFSTTHSSILCL